MSQSDYLRRKRVVTVLKNDSAENPVYNSKQFLDFKQYQVENSVISDNITYKRLSASGETKIFLEWKEIYLTVHRLNVQIHLNDQTECFI